MVVTISSTQKCLTHNMKKNKNQFWELMFKTFLFKIWLVVRNCMSATKTLPAVILKSIRDFINSIWLFYIHMAPPTKKERCKVCWATGRCFMRSGCNWLHRSVHICTFIILKIKPNNHLIYFKITLNLLPNRFRWSCTLWQMLSKTGCVSFHLSRSLYSVFIVWLDDRRQPVPQTGSYFLVVVEGG